MCRRIVCMWLSVFLSAALVITAVQPVLAEAPPPPGDSSDGSSPPLSATPIENESDGPEEPAEAASLPSTEAVPLSERVAPPGIEADAVNAATQAVFVDDEQILDANGSLRAQGEPLAAMFAPVAIACPPGKIPTIYGGLNDTGCTIMYSSALYPNPIQSANDDPKTIAGWTIWVEQGYNLSGISTNITKSINVAGDTNGTSITGGIAIQSANVTLRDLVISNGLVSSTGQLGLIRLQGLNIFSGIVGYGIDINGHKGNIILNHIHSTINTGGGARLDALGGTGTVTVLNSSFDDNTGRQGLWIDARNSVRLENVSANFNAMEGIYVRYKANLTLKNISLVKNGIHGIWAEDVGTTGGVVTVQNASAVKNTSIGLYFRNVGTLTLTNGHFEENAADGLGFFQPRGAVVLRNMNVIGNSMVGVRIFDARGTVSVYASKFIKNVQQGLNLTSKNTVTVKNSYFLDNGNTGLHVDNSSAVYTPSVNLTNNWIYQNNLYGIWAKSKGTVTLSAITSLENACNGIHVETLGGVTISGTYGFNQVNGNGPVEYCPGFGKSGVFIDAQRAVSISNVSANENGWDGIEVKGSSSLRVTYATLNQNAQAGLFANSIKGSIVIDRVNASDNVSFNGLYLFNDSVPASSYPVTITNTVANGNRAGIELFTRGAVVFSNVAANLNKSWDGIGIYTASSARLTSIIANENYASGIFILARGTITLDKIVASSNLTYDGIKLEHNSTTVGNPAVSVKNSVTDFNKGFGLLITTKGAVTLSHVSANQNLIYGIYVDNRFGGTGSGSVTISNTLGDNLASFNKQDNLRIYTKGSVTITGLDASASTLGNGAYIVTEGSGNVSISSSQFNQNEGIGVTVTSLGSITLNTLTANLNNSGGAKLYNANTTLAGKTITVNRSVLNNNLLFGAQIESKSTITLNNVTANFNDPSLGGYGVIIDNCIGSPCSGTGNVYIQSSLGRNQFNENGANGIKITTAGNISISNAQVYHNHASGIEIHSNGIAKSAVLTCVSSTVNSAYGLDLLLDAGSMSLTLNSVFLGGNSSGAFQYPGTPLIIRTTCP